MRFAGTYPVGVSSTYINSGSECDMFSDTTQTIQIRNRIQISMEKAKCFFGIFSFLFIYSFRCDFIYIVCFGRNQFSHLASVRMNVAVGKAAWQFGQWNKRIRFFLFFFFFLIFKAFCARWCFQLFRFVSYMGNGEMMSFNSTSAMSLVSCVTIYLIGRWFHMCRVRERETRTRSTLLFWSFLWYLIWSMIERHEMYGNFIERHTSCTEKRYLIATHCSANSCSWFSGRIEHLSENAHSCSKVRVTIAPSTKVEEDPRHHI